MSELNQFAYTHLDHFSNLNVLNRFSALRNTGIICTIGPACKSVETLQQMMRCGMNIARLNFSHGSYAYHEETINLVREAAATFDEFKTPIAIALDTKGPEIRTGLINGSGTAEVLLVKDQPILVTVNKQYENNCNENVVWVDYCNLIRVVDIGSLIFVDDGLICLKVIQRGTDHVECIIETGGKLGSKKGVNLPGLAVDLPAISEKDKADLKFGLEQKVDIIFASFIRNGDAVREIRSVIGNDSVKIISKIENCQGIDNIDDIIAQSDGIMVARGDMGIEIASEKVFAAQKMIISKCNKAGKPVICATQMLESMIEKPLSTRAESADVANAVLDGADCVMLSGETAKGKYPLEAVKTMHAVALEAEHVFFHRMYFQNILMYDAQLNNEDDSLIGISAAVVQATFSCKIAGIFVLTATGRTAQMISRYRPRCPIFAVTRNEAVARQGNLFYGVRFIVYNEPEDRDRSRDVNNRIDYLIKYALISDFIQLDDNLIVVSASNPGPGTTDSFRIVKAADFNQK